jgi:hypothetical protein
VGARRPAQQASPSAVKMVDLSQIAFTAVQYMRRARVEYALFGRTSILTKSMAKRALAVVRGYFGMLVLGAMATDSFGSCCI